LQKVKSLLLMRKHKQFDKEIAQKIVTQLA
jgi:hypothetical protein